MQLNRVEIVGNLTQDPEAKRSQRGEYCQFTIGVNETWKDANGQKQERVDFFDIVAFDAVAKAIVSYKKKGDPIFVEGKLRQNTWETDSGEKRSRIKIQARNVQFLNRSNGQSNAANTPDDFDDDIPF